MKEKSKPCPHCGAEVKISHAMGEWWFDCRCQGMKATKRQAIADWNRRHCGEPGWRHHTAFSGQVKENEQ